MKILRSLLVFALLASFGHAGVKTFPPIGGGVIGSSGPLADEQIPPIAAFSCTPLTGDIPLEIVCTDASDLKQAAATFAWDFGDGGASTEQNPTYEYAANGTFTVTLTVTNGGGSDAEEKVDYVEATFTDSVAPVAALTSPDTGNVANPVDMTCTFTDAAPSSGPDRAEFFYRYCPLGVCGAEVAIHTDNTATGGPATYTFNSTWDNQPNCGVAPQSTFRLVCYVYDVAGNVSIASAVNVLASFRGC